MCNTGYTYLADHVSGSCGSEAGPGPGPVNEGNDIEDNDKNDDGTDSVRLSTLAIYRLETNKGSGIRGIEVSLGFSITRESRGSTLVCLVVLGRFTWELFDRVTCSSFQGFLLSIMNEYCSLPISPYVHILCKCTCTRYGVHNRSTAHYGSTCHLLYPTCSDIHVDVLTTFILQPVGVFDSTCLHCALYCTCRHAQTKRRLPAYSVLRNGHLYHLHRNSTHTRTRPTPRPDRIFSLNECPI